MRGLFVIALGFMSLVAFACLRQRLPPLLNARLSIATSTMVRMVRLPRATSGVRQRLKARAPQPIQQQKNKRITECVSGAQLPVSS
jgi:hypothetical protein